MVVSTMDLEIIAQHREKDYLVAKMEKDLMVGSFQDIELLEKMSLSMNMKIDSMEVFGLNKIREILSRLEKARI